MKTTDKIESGVGAAAGTATAIGCHAAAMEFANGLTRNKQRL